MKCALGTVVLLGWACSTTDPDPPVVSNNPPVVTAAIPAQTLHVGQSATLDLSQYFNDPDGDALSYTAETVNANVATVSVAGSSATVAGVSQGNTSITVTARDPDGLTAQQTFAVDVPNRAPEAVGVIPDLDLIEGDTLDIEVSGYFTDPDDDMLSYDVATSDGGVTQAFVTGETVTLVAWAAGTASVVVTASDPGGMSVEQSFSTVVDLRGDPRVEFVTVSAGAPEGGTVTFEVQLRPPPLSTLQLGYTFGADDDPDTDDADETDLGGMTGGTLEIDASERRATFEIVVSDDDEIEPAREVLAISLNPPGENAGYILGEISSAVLIIEEGVCDRTPRVRDALIEASGAVDCRETDGSHLALIDTLDLSSPLAPGAHGGPITESPSPGRESCAPQRASGTRQGAGEPQRPLAPGCSIRSAKPTRAPAMIAYRNSTGTDEPITELRTGDFHGLTELRELWLFGNRLKELPPGIFADLGELERLLLGYNRLAELPPGVFSGLSRLKDLSFQVNELTDLPPGILSGLSRLEELWIHTNDLRELPDGISELSNLRRFVAWENRIETLPPVFSGLADLELISLQQNRLAAIHDDALADLPSLDHLGLSHNRLTELSPGLFSDLDEVTSLLLAGNQLERLRNGVFDGLDNLTLLDLSENRLSEFENAAFSGLDELEELWLHDNRISSLAPGIFSPLSNLRLLGLGGNRFVTVEPGLFDGLTGLRTLVLGENPFTELRRNTFVGLAGLEGLWLDQGGLLVMEPGTFNGLHNLTHLILSENRVSRLESGVFADLSSLQQLWVSENRLTQISPGAFEGMPRLDLLVMSDNPIGTLPPTAFSTLTRLEELWMGEDELDELPIGIFGNLEELRLLYLAGNELEELPEKAFTGLSQLGRLHLEENPGSPFSLSVRLQRTDTTDLTAPGPATVVAVLPEGAPYSMRIPLSVNQGTASIDTVVIQRGRMVSPEFTVTMSSGSQSGTDVAVGPAPPVPATLIGIIAVAADTLRLFTTSGDTSGAEPGVAALLEDPSPENGGLVSATLAAGLLGSTRPRVRRRSRGKGARPRTGCNAAGGRCTPVGRGRSAGARAWSRHAAERGP